MKPEGSQVKTSSIQLGFSPKQSLTIEQTMLAYIGRTKNIMHHQNTLVDDSNKKSLP